MSNQKTCSCLLLAALAIGIGCEKSAYEATLSGKVTVNGTAVPTGQVLLQSDSNAGKVFIGRIEKDGTYRVVAAEGSVGIEPGNYKIAIVAEETSAMDAQGKSTTKNYLSKKYADASSSGLTVNITKAKNTKDFALDGPDAK